MRRQLRDLDAQDACKIDCIGQGRWEQFGAVVGGAGLISFNRQANKVEFSAIAGWLT